MAAEVTEVKIDFGNSSFKNWQGIPLISASVIVNLIGATKTEKGLSIRCVLDENEYKKGHCRFG
ncbi:MAG: hypothetical protein LBQ54_13825 [Planctomycetaceae bacterium]|jgi:hypothetical protein|nr:hypothetical protein [Planctomycetaceae bacterium]